MSFGCADGTFSNVVMMYIRGHELILGMPPVFNLLLVCFSGLVIKDLEVNFVAPGGQAVHNGVVGCNVVYITVVVEC